MTVIRDTHPRSARGRQARDELDLRSAARDPASYPHRGDQARRCPGTAEPVIRPYTLYTRVVYITCMSRVRTNIEIEDTYLQAVMDRYGLRTKTEAVDLALRHLAGQPMSREEALAMRGVRAIGKLPADTGPARVR